MANVVEIIIKGIDKTKEGFTMPIRNLSDLGKAVEKVAPFFLGLAATAETAFLVIAEHAIDTIDEMSKLAQKAGTTTEAFSANAYGAKLAGVEVDSLKKGYKELSVVLTEAAKGGNEQANLFNSLGISVVDAEGKLRSSDSVLLDVANRFADTADGAGKTAVAVKLFGGKIGQDLIPFLNQGAQGLRDMQDEAKLFGQVISTEAGKSAEEFNDNLNRLKLLAEGVVNVFVSEFLPKIAEVTTAFIKWTKESGKLHDAMGLVAEMGRAVAQTIVVILEGIKAYSDNVEQAIKLLVRWGQVGLDVFRLQADGATNVGKVLLELAKGPFGDVQGAMTTLRSGLRKDWTALSADAKVGVQQLGSTLATFSQGAENILAKALGLDRLAGMFKDAVSKAFSGAASTEKPPLKVFNEEGFEKFFNEQMKQGQQMAEFRRKLHTEALTGIDAEMARENDRFQQQLEHIHSLGASESEARAFREEAELNHTQKLLDIQANYYEQRRKLDVEMQANIATGSASQKILEDQRYNERLKQIGSLGLTEEQSQDLIISAYKEHKKKTTQIFNDELGEVSSAFGGMAEAAKAFGKKGFAAYKAFAIAQTVIDTYRAAQGAYSALASIPFVGPVLGVAAAAAAIVSGMARVAAIRSQEPGVAHAGLSYVPQEATYVLQHGERVLAPEQNEDLTEFLNNRSSGGPVLVLDGRVIGEVLGNMTKDGRLEISERSLVAA